MWRKSSYSNPNGECVEMDQWTKASFSDAGNCLEWRRASFSFSNGNCVEVARDVLVRDSKLAAASPVLKFTPAAWADFITSLK